MLWPGGQIVLIDFQRIPGKSTEWVLGHMCAGQEVFVQEITSAGFKVVGEEKFLKENYFVRFEKKSVQLEKKDGPQQAHNVFFSLKDNSPAEVQKVVDACKKYLTKHEGEVLFFGGHSGQGSQT